MKKNQKILTVIGIVIIGFSLWILFFSQKPEIHESPGVILSEEVVVPAGNTYADPQFLNPEEFLPFNKLPAAVAEQFKKLAPEYKEPIIQKLESEGNISWSVKTVISEKDTYTFSFLPDGKIIQVSSFIDDETENAGRIFIEGNIFEIRHDQIPEPVLKMLTLLGFDKNPSRAYSVKALGGKDAWVYHFDVSNCRFIIMDNTGVKYIFQQLFSIRFNSSCFHNFSSNAKRYLFGRLRSYTDSYRRVDSTYKFLRISITFKAC